MTIRAVVDTSSLVPSRLRREVQQWDEPIWAAAKVGAARYVVSENTRHYPPRQPDGRRGRQGIEYMPGRAFLNLVTAGAGADR